jgi:complement component 1 Q subcomponent-binding protein
VSDLDVPSDAELPIEGEVAAEDTDASPYITCSLVITKHAHPDAMSVDLEAGEDGFEVTNVAMFESAVAEAEGAEGDWQRRSKYMGPRECFCISS